MKSVDLRRLCVMLAATWTVAASLQAGDIKVDGSLVSTVATGTPPIAVTSTTKVENLNADLLDGLDSSAFLTAGSGGEGSGFDADLLDGLDSSAFARALGNVVRVGKTGGDFASIQAALDSITTASAANPFLVLVGPGVYDERVVMKSFVDLQGAGEGVTRITQSGGSPTAVGTVVGADDAELRSLTVESSGGAGFVVGVHNQEVSPRLVHVTVEVDGSATTVYGIFNEATPGIPSAPELTHVTVRVDGTNQAMGIVSQVEADTRMRAVRVHVGGSGSGVKYGLWILSAAPVADDVEVTAASDETTASVFGVSIQDAPAAVLRQLRVAVSGGGTRYGVYGALTEVTLRDLEVGVSGEGASYGVYGEAATIVLEACSIESEAEGTSSVASAVFLHEASGELRDCTVEGAPGAAFSAGVSGFDSTGSGAYTFDIHHARLAGANAAISVPPTYAVRVGASQLDGSLTATAPICAFSYDGAFNMLSSSCAATAP